MAITQWVVAYLPKADVKTHSPCEIATGISCPRNDKCAGVRKRKKLSHFSGFSGMMLWVIHPLVDCIYPAWAYHWEDNMGYTDLIFDLYGTLVDIHTEEDAAVWERTALYFGYHGASYTGPGLEAAFHAAMAAREARAGQSYECFPDIPFEDVMAELFRAAGVRAEVEALGVGAARLFRIASTEYIRLYPGVLTALATLRARGYRLWLLSNAQQVFTTCELRHLGLDGCFDGVYLSSAYGCRKPDGRFFRALLEGEGLDPARCLMIGNDRQTDIAGARALGLGTLYLHTALTPAEQAAAEPSLHPACCTGPHYELEGSDWAALTRLLCGLEEGT